MEIPIRFYAYGLLLLAVAGAYAYWHNHVFTQGKAAGTALVTAYRAGASQAVAEYKAREKAAHEAGKAVTDKGAAQVATTRDHTHETIRTVTQYIHDKPSAAVCVGQPLVVQALDKAIRDANAAAKD